MFDIIVVLIVVGTVIYVINALVPMDGRFKLVINVLLVVFTVIWLMKVTGVASYLNRVGP